MTALRVVLVSVDPQRDTPELLNEYLHDEPEPAPATPPPKAGKAPARSQKAGPVAPPTRQNTAAPGGTFAAGLALSATQQALRQLFAGQNLTVPQTAVEAFAKAHGALRNQLIDNLNECCYELLDDVLIEESGDDYTIYKAHYQQLIASC